MRRAVCMQEGLWDDFDLYRQQLGSPAHHWCLTPVPPEACRRLQRVYRPWAVLHAAWTTTLRPVLPRTCSAAAWRLYTYEYMT